MSSSGRDEYQTPPALFRALDDEFMFDLDLAATEENALCHPYCSEPCYGSESNCGCGLHAGLTDRRIFCNPPYSDLRPWAARFGELGLENMVAAILPVDPTTRWWATMIETVHELRFTGRRVNFVHAPGCHCDACTAERGPAGNNKGTVIAIWRPGLKPLSPVVHWGWDWKD